MAATSFHWDVFLNYVLHPQDEFWKALITTTVIAVVSMVLGTGLGLISCLAHRSSILPVRWVAKAYVLVIRGTPVIVQIFFIFFGIKTITGFDPFPTQMIIGPVVIPGAVVAGIVALALNEGAYMSEIIRSGIDAVPKGQLEAARSVGMSHRLTMRRIILPQAAPNHFAAVRKRVQRNDQGNLPGRLHRRRRHLFRRSGPVLHLIPARGILCRRGGLVSVAHRNLGCGADLHRPSPQRQ